MNRNKNDELNYDKNKYSMIKKIRTKETKQQKEARIRRMAENPKPSEETRKQLLAYWIESGLTMGGFSTKYGIDDHKMQYWRKQYKVYVENIVKRLLYDSVVRVSQSNSTKIEKIVRIAKNRIQAKEDLMKIIKKQSKELADSYETAEGKEKDTIVYKAMQLLKLLDNTRDEEISYLEKLKAVTGVDIQITGEGNNEITIDTQIKEILLERDKEEGKNGEK